MKIKLSLDEKEIRNLIAAGIRAKFPHWVALTGDKLPIQVKSKQNYRSEWEEASIRIECEVPNPAEVEAF